MKTIVEYLNEIANILGDTQPDEITTQADAYEHIIAQMKDGGDTFVVNYYGETDNLSTFSNTSCDKTYTEVKTAIESGKRILCYITVKYATKTINLVATQYGIGIGGETDIDFNSVVHILNSGTYVHMTASVSHTSYDVVAMSLKNS